MERDENEERDRYDDRKMDAKVYLCLCVRCDHHIPITSPGVQTVTLMPPPHNNSDIDGDLFAANTHSTY